MKHITIATLWTLAACGEMTVAEFQTQSEIHQEDVQAKWAYGGPGDTVPPINGSPTEPYPWPPTPAGQNCWIDAGASCREIGSVEYCAWDYAWAWYDSGAWTTAKIADTHVVLMADYAQRTWGSLAYPTDTCTQHYNLGATMRVAGGYGNVTCGPRANWLSTQCVSEGFDDLEMDVETLYTFSEL